MLRYHSHSVPLTKQVQWLYTLMLGIELVTAHTSQQAGIANLQLTYIQQEMDLWSTKVSYDRLNFRQPLKQLTWFVQIWCDLLIWTASNVWWSWFLRLPLVYWAASQWTSDLEGRDRCRRGGGSHTHARTHTHTHTHTHTLYQPTHSHVWYTGRFGLSKSFSVILEGAFVINQLSWLFQCFEDLVRPVQSGHWGRLYGWQYG